MGEPGRQFRDDHQFQPQKPPPQPDVPVPGRGTMVTNGPTTIEGLVAQQLRTAIGALTQLKTMWIPQLDAATNDQVAASEMAILNAKSALLRAEQGMSQAGGLRERVKSPEIEQLWQTANVERDAVAPRLLELFVAQDNLPTEPTLLEGDVHVSADTGSGSGSGVPITPPPPPPPQPQQQQVPAKTTPAPTTTPPAVTPTPTVAPPAVTPAPKYAPTWADIAKAAEGNTAALAALDVSWIDQCHRLVVQGIDAAFLKEKTENTFEKELAFDKGLRKLDTEHTAAGKKLITDEIAARKANTVAPPTKDDLKEATIKKDPAVLKKQQELDQEYADDKAKQVAEARKKFDARKYGHSAKSVDVAKPPKEGVTAEEGRLLARANFMSWGIHVLGSAAALKAHFLGMEEVLKLSSKGDPLLLAKSAAQRLVAALAAFELQYPGNTFFQTDVGFGLRNAHNESHRLSYLGHALGYSIDFQAVANPSFLNKADGLKTDLDGSVARFMIKKFAGTDVGGKHVDPKIHMAMPNDHYKEIQAMGVATGKGEAISKRGEEILAATTSYGEMTATSDRFRASQATNMTELKAAKAKWIEIHGQLPHDIKDAKGVLKTAQTAAAKKANQDPAIKAIKVKADFDAAVKKAIEEDQAVVEANKKVTALEADLATKAAEVEATVDKAFAPWVKQIQAEIDELKQPPSDADKALAEKLATIEAALREVRAAKSRAALLKLTEKKGYEGLFDAEALGKLPDDEAVRAAMVERLTKLRTKNPGWNKGEIGTRTRLIERLSSGQEVFGNVKSGGRKVGGKYVPFWFSESYVNAPPVMQLLEIGFARHDELAPAPADPTKPGSKKQVFNREFIMTMMRFGFAPLATSDDFLDTMHFDFLEGHASTPAGSFFDTKNYSP